MTKRVRFIGDIHGDITTYENLIAGCEHSVQVGDFGIGFVPHKEYPNTHRFIRGNHDNPELCRKHPNWIPDGTVEGPVMYVGGAWSIDREWRTIGIDWWPDEECSWEELQNYIDIYEKVKPKIMVTHDIPSHAIIAMQKPIIKISTRTQQAFDIMYSIHKPHFHIHGHWHNGMIDNVLGTCFISLGINGYVDLEIP